MAPQWTFASIGKQENVLKFRNSTFSREDEIGTPSKITGVFGGLNVKNSKVHMPQIIEMIFKEPLST